MTLQKKIIDDLTAAMKAKDADKVSVLRMVKAALMNRQIEKGSELTDDEITKALQTLVKQRRDSAEQYENAGRAELAAKENAEIAFIEAYLPRAASENEIAAAVEAAVAETGASSMKDMGAVMKAAMANLAGKSADGKKVSEAVKNRLSGN
ncbi:MAG: GatB/YqeY domain-containing protein [Acidobacteriota bacterium]|nr:MAG: GatB/YqeY domain-containing protein [Acidobacteriota bacterium]